MLASFKHRLTFANVVALIALFVSLGGGVYAATKINGKKIKKESIAGDKLKPDAVTGRQVDESSLGKVPSAQSADSAQTLAGTGPDGFAQASDMRRWHFEATPVDGAAARESRLQIGSLELATSCSAGGPRTTLVLGARSSAPNAAFDVGADRRNNQGGTHGGRFGTGFETVTLDNTENDFAREVGTLVYNAPGETITVTYAFFISDGIGSGFCNLVATATRVTD